MTDAEWVAEFAFLVDISGHLNELNLKLQGRQNLAHNLYNHVKAFFSNPFEVDVESIYAEFQMEIIELQTNTEMQQSFNNFELREKKQF